MHLKDLNVPELVAAWTSLCAVLSLLNKYVLLPLWPNGARGFSAILSILPGHVGNAIEDVQAIIKDVKTGGTPPPNAGDGGPALSTPKSKPPPPAALRIGFAALALICAVGVGSACIKASDIPSNTPADIKGATDCVVTAVLSGGSLGGCLVEFGPALVADIVQTLLHSTQFKAAHPEAVPLLEAHKAALAR
jgi:hypothetical protein